MRTAGTERLVSCGTDLSACVVRRTSGTTGEPFTIYYTPGEGRTRQLIQFRTLLAMGFRAFDRLAILGPEHVRASRLHDRLGIYRTRVIPGTACVEEQIAALQEFRPTILWSYPHSIWVLAHHLGYRLSSIVRPRMLITSGQVLDPVLRERIRAGLGIEMFNSYGAIETGRIAAEGAVHRGLHVNADQLLVECLDGSRPSAPGKTGTVAVTVLGALAMPFIRYRLGDRLALAGERCPCGSSFPFIAALEGREDDVIRMPSGKLVPALPDVAGRL